MLSYPDMQRGDPYGFSVYYPTLVMGAHLSQQLAR
jgi:hypothetical protein